MAKIEFKELDPNANLSSYQHIAKTDRQRNLFPLSTYPVITALTGDSVKFYDSREKGIFAMWSEPVSEYKFLCVTDCYHFYVLKELDPSNEKTLTVFVKTISCDS
ncbi:MAG: hypothetical protein H7A37_07670 [Chlamydiales bacterium]|nr:hypothetical protein [Chlamydiia bacterium]MCP5508163.1 hypothetical protein [Chlamydiales bacterium]